ncbi:MAG: peptidylprolyl isomerase [Myxococcota bacterium]|nr:peptidylprolyl isomerase [Myxococcota bacterium]
MGWFHKGQLQPAFEDAAFALDVGAVSAVIASPVGFHVMKRLD